MLRLLAWIAAWINPNVVKLSGRVQKGQKWEKQLRKGRFRFRDLEGVKPLLRSRIRPTSLTKDTAIVEDQRLLWKISANRIHK
jgi:hypothetical protein